VIFVDTSYWAALRNERDGRHGDAVALIRQVGSSPLLTTNHVRGETWTLLRRRAGHRSAIAFLDALERSPRLTMVNLDPAMEARALRWLRRHDERPYSFVDATSFIAMKVERIKEALAFDGDFSAAGYVELRP